MNKIIIIILLWAPTNFYATINYVEYARTHLLKHNSIDSLLFLPQSQNEPNAKYILIGLIDSEHKAICIAQFRLTDKDIADALMRARDRKVEIEIITDKSALHEKTQKIAALQAKGARVYVYDKKFSLMHLKLFIFAQAFKEQKKVVWFGSANATSFGFGRNQEMVTVRDNIVHVNRCMEHFSDMKKLLNKMYGVQMIKQLPYAQRYMGKIVSYLQKNMKK